MSTKQTLEQLNNQILACERCPRLLAHCHRVAVEKRRAYARDVYHGAPVPNFLPPLTAPTRSAPRRVSGAAAGAGIHLLIVGLAPGAHGANRTGRMFTGDRSGDFLYRALHETGFASQPTSTRVGDGLTLAGAVVTAACHCAPPGNKPLPAELARCAPWLEQTFDLLPELAVVVCLGGLALGAVLGLYQRRGWIAARSGYRFGHGARFDIAGAPIVLCSYHPSQQNTFTGRLTAPMLRAVFIEARKACGNERVSRG